MIVKILNDNPELQFEIGGHASKTGTGAAATAANQKLSEQRAEAVRTQLTSLGIDAGRLTAKGYGETQPIADNATPEGRANNQRVEFTKL
ncbi:MAG: OmpA family protein [Chitinophagaceae bacterium]|nr:OmpA family protein [Chitinophagaceae bacterium]